MWDATQFIKKYKEVSNFSLYGFARYEYAFISDEYPRQINYDPTQVAIGYLDIEVCSTQGFPFPEKAEHEVTVISVMKKEKIYVLATKEYVPSDSNVTFIYCKTEKELLAKFLNVWEQLDLDIVSGWNIEGFDIPYLINRIVRLFSEDEAKRLSPWRKIERREKEYMGKMHVEYYISGIAILDYMAVYKKFTQSARDSYSLNNISYIELKEKKIDYSQYESLNDLWDKDPSLYIDYNIQDTVLVSRLEKKLRFLELIMAIAYDAKVNYVDALGSVLLWEVLIYNYLKNKNMVSPLKGSSSIRREFEGAHVKTPLVGMFDWVVSFDLTSLYPHIIMGWNISPETAQGKWPAYSNIQTFIDGPIVYDKPYSVAANGYMYDTDNLGFLPALMEEQFAKRNEYRDKMTKAKKRHKKSNLDEDEAEYSKYYNYQWAQKIKLNSAYGAVSNPYFTFYNADDAEAVTLTGQVVIQRAEKKMNEFLNTRFNTSGIDYVVASDTDSLYLNLGQFVRRGKFTSVTKKIDALDEFSEKVIIPQFKVIFDDLTNEMRCRSNTLHMKRENIIEKALWRAKKNYACYVWDSEGVRNETPELKIMGMESVRSSTPEICRKKLKEAIELMFTRGQAEVHAFIKEFEKEYYTLPIYDIARPLSVKDYDKWRGGELYIKAAPIQVKAALQYNKKLREMKLDTKYPIIFNGDKIKYVNLVEFNPVFDGVIGAPNGNFPKEFGIEPYIDRKLMFEKTFHNPIKSLLRAANWETDKISTLEKFFA